MAQVSESFNMLIDYSEHRMSLKVYWRSGSRSRLALWLVLTNVEAQKPTTVLWYSLGLPSTYKSKCRGFIVFGNFKNVSKRENQWESHRVRNSRPCRKPSLHLVKGLFFSVSCYHFKDTVRCTWPPRVNALHKCQHLLINVNWPLSNVHSSHWLQ